jgi:hypothetical protein
MHRIATLVVAICLTAVSGARADYRFQFAQFDDVGNELERGAWRCADVDVRANRCSQGILLVIAGRRQRLEMRFFDDGGRLRIAMAAGARVASAVAAKPLIFDKKRRDCQPD